MILYNYVPFQMETSLKGEFDSMWTSVLRQIDVDVKLTYILRTKIIFLKFACTLRLNSIISINIGLLHKMVYSMSTCRYSDLDLIHY